MKRLSLKIPQNKQIFLSSSGNKIGSLLEENKKIFSQYSFKILNQPFKIVREKVRKNILEEAYKFSSKFDHHIEEKIDSSYQYIIQTGHQPVFFHPGIWIKNIFLNELLKSPFLDRCLGLNVILDNDLCKELSLPLPALSESGGLRLEKINFLSTAQDLPFEECSLPSLKLINEFTENIINRIKPLENKNILNNFINFSRCLENSFCLCNQNYCDSNLGEFLGMARRLYENEVNPVYLELPFSQICNIDELLSFFLEIIKNIESFSGIYNKKLEEYRKLFKIRNRANPSPNLVIKENLIEVPFWIWRSRDNRRKIYILKEQDKIYLYNDSYGKIFLLDKYDSKSLFSLKTILKEQGLKIRPKALLLTLYNRLFISDLFIHGLGGAKYDLVTDEIIREFFKVKPPHFLVMSSTLLLDFKSYYSSSRLKVSSLKKKIRDLEFNPERYISEMNLPEETLTQIQEIVSKKDTLIQKIRGVLTPAEKRKISEEIKFLNKSMGEKFEPLKYELNRKIEEEEERIKQSKIYNFREFPFCFFTAKILQNLLKFKLISKPTKPQFD